MRLYTEVRFYAEEKVAQDINFYNSSIEFYINYANILVDGLKTLASGLKTLKSVDLEMVACIF